MPTSASYPETSAMDAFANQFATICRTTSGNRTRVSSRAGEYSTTGPMSWKHSQRVLAQQPAATLLYQLHYVPEKPATFSFAELQRGLPSTSARFTGEDAFEQQAGFSWTGDDVFKQLEERRATLLLGQSLIITGQIYSELCPADELPSWLPLEDY